MKRTIYTLTLLLSILSVIEPLSAFQKKTRQSTFDTKQAIQKKSNANYGKYDFSMTTLENKTLRLSDYAGKVVLVNIWAPWCGPCRREMPGFQKIYDQYKSKGFDIVGIATDTNTEDVKDFIAKYKVAWPMGLNDEIPGAYGTYGLPDNYLFAADGSLVKHFIGFTSERILESAIEEAFKKSVSSIQ